MSKDKKFQRWMRDNNASISYKPHNGSYTWVFESDNHTNIYDDEYSDLKTKIDYHIYHETENHFYLEISGRQTGKTTRMIEAMNYHIKNGGTCVVCCYKYNNFKIILDQYKSRYNLNNQRDILYYNNSLTEEVVQTTESFKVKYF
jgi:hypothetical protein